MSVEDSVARDQLRAFVERIERMNEEKAAINADISDIYKEAKGNGFDTKVLKKIVADRSKDANERMEFDAIYELYAVALGMIAEPDFDEPRVQVQARVREATTSAPKITPSRPTKAAGQATAAIADSSEEASPSSAESEASGSGTVADASAQISEPQLAPQAGSDLASPPNPQGQVADIQPETADQSTDASQERAQTATGLGTGGDNLDPASRPTATAKTDVPSDRGQASGGGQSQDNSGVRVASVDPITYPAPGLVVMEHTPPEGIVAHPFAAVWPVNNIDVSEGVRQAIVKIGKLMLDGRGRYFAARAAGFEYPVVQYDGADPLMDSIRWNLDSRPNLHPHNLKIIATKLVKLEPSRSDEIMAAFGLDEEMRAAE